jgi:hypothetical protein
MLYSWDDGLHAVTIHSNEASIIEAGKDVPWAHIGFWPYGYDIRQAVEWWEEVKDENAALPPSGGSA